VVNALALGLSAWLSRILVQTPNSLRTPGAKMIYSD
jgi:hypothetical protein